MKMDLKNAPFLPKRLQGILRAAILGAVLFAIYSIAIVLGEYQWGGGKTGEFWPDFYLGQLFLISVPSIVLLQSLKLEDSHFLNTASFGTIVNALLGAVIFASIAAVWQFLSKKVSDE